MAGAAMPQKAIWLCTMDFVARIYPVGCQSAREHGNSHSARCVIPELAFLAHPGSEFEILTARRSGTLVGYAVFSQRGEEANIADICCTGGPALVARLMSGTVDILKSRNVVTVSMNAGENHPWNTVFERAGFRKRESSPVITHSPQEPALFARTTKSPGI